MKVSVAFRVDASIDIGTGHVMRCLTLADALREKGAQSVFLCRPHLGHLMDLIQARGYEVKNLNTSYGEYKPSESAGQYAAWLGADWASDARVTSEVLERDIFDWIVVDHYALDQKWEKFLRKYCRNLMVIDDLADRTHDCDLLLDQNFGRLRGDYAGLVPESSAILMGPNFALLKPEFSQMRLSSLARRVNPKLERLLITMGGVDKLNMTQKVLQALKRSVLPENLRVTVVLGAKAPHIEQITQQIVSLPWPVDLLIDVKDMAKVMAASDLVIGAAGCTAWECCCLGLPMIIIPLAENQKAGAVALKKDGSAILLDDCESIPEVFRNLSNTCLLALTDKAATLVDGFGSSKVLFEMFKKSFSLRKATLQDEMLFHDWFNDQLTRKNSFDSKPVSLATHRTWFFNKLANPDQSRIFVMEESGKPVGQIRFDKNDRDEWEIAYSIEACSRGRGLGAIIVNCGVNTFSSGKNGVVLLAKVKKFNLASQKTFESLAFTKSDIGCQYVLYTKKIGS
jgi:UDP-2,4-diacetamido-2,4,6-trideoxy-beta-L-altropyranose hydrolase